MKPTTRNMQRQKKVTEDGGKGEKKRIEKEQ
jgi:hypothetical protein